MSVTITVPDAPDSTQIVSIDNTEYKIRLTYNTRDNHWRFTLMDTTNVVIVAGIKLLPNRNLTWRYQYITGMPKGNFYCFRLKNDFSDVGRDNLGVGKSYELIYLTESEDSDYGFQY